MDRVRVVDVELTDPPAPIAGLQGYLRALVLVRLHGTPIGSIELPVIDGRSTATAVRTATLDRLFSPIVRHLLADALDATPRLGFWDVLSAQHPQTSDATALVTVAVCTRDRPVELATCLDALVASNYSQLEVLVVDNAPRGDATERLVRDSYPSVRYVREPRPGLNWARNRAIVEASGDILAFTDDDVVVDPGWVRAIVGAFADPAVAAVTGLIVPLELETEAQLLFERYGGFGKGFRRRWFRIDQPTAERPVPYHAAWQFGAGANMAFRRGLFDRVGLFDPALDVGTPTNGGGDLEMFFRVLKAGYTLAYEPEALVRHRHRRSRPELKTQIRNNGTGACAYLLRTAMAYPDERIACLRFGLRWLATWHLRRMLASLVRPGRLPRELIWAEFRGMLAGPARLRAARRRAEELARSFGPMPPPRPADPVLPPPVERARRNAPVAVRTIDLAAPLAGLIDVTDAAAVEVAVARGGQSLGLVTIANGRQPVSARRLREAVVDGLGLKLIADAEAHAEDTHQLWEHLDSALRSHVFAVDEDGAVATSDAAASAPLSVVVAAGSEPNHLRACLDSLTVQRTARSVDLIVVAGEEARGPAAATAADFPGVRFLGGAYQKREAALRAGVAAAIGEIVAICDAHLVVDEDWIERLTAPFERADVMVVTGSVSPGEAWPPSPPPAGEGRAEPPGSERREYGATWFDAFRYRVVPVWRLGSTANAAVRADLFRSLLGADANDGLAVPTAVGAGADLYLLYRVLKAGYTVVHEPGARAWDQRPMEGIARRASQRFHERAGYELTTLVRDRDLRPLTELTLALPRDQARRLPRRAKGVLGRVRASTRRGAANG